MLAASLLLTSIPRTTFATGGIPSLVIGCTTREGTLFTGRVMRLNPSSLDLQPLDEGPPTQLGIPLEAIRSVRLDPGRKGNASLLDQLEACSTLLPLLDQASLGQVLDCVEAASANKQWQTVFRWAARLAELPANETFHRQCALLKASALYELGLHTRALEEASQLAAAIDPLDAPPRLCSLMAALSPDPDRVRFWSLLPSLQIPSQPSSLVPRP